MLSLYIGRKVDEDYNYIARIRLGSDTLFNYAKIILYKYDLTTKVKEKLNLPDFVNDIKSGPSRLDEDFEVTLFNFSDGKDRNFGFWIQFQVNSTGIFDELNIHPMETSDVYHVKTANDKIFCVSDDDFKIYATAQQFEMMIMEGLMSKIDEILENLVNEKIESLDLNAVVRKLVNNKVKDALDKVRVLTEEELWTGPTTPVAQSNGLIFNLSDSVFNYDYIRFYYCHHVTYNNTLEIVEYKTDLTMQKALGATATNNGGFYLWQYGTYNKALVLDSETAIRQIATTDANYTIITKISGIKWKKIEELETSLND